MKSLKMLNRKSMGKQEEESVSKESQSNESELVSKEAELVSKKSSGSEEASSTSSPDTTVPEEQDEERCDREESAGRDNNDENDGDRYNTDSGEEGEGEGLNSSSSMSMRGVGGAKRGVLSKLGKGGAKSMKGFFIGGKFGSAVVKKKVLTSFSRTKAAPSVSSGLPASTSNKSEDPSSESTVNSDSKIQDDAKEESEGKPSSNGETEGDQRPTLASVKVAGRQFNLLEVMSSTKDSKGDSDNSVARPAGAHTSAVFEVRAEVSLPPEMEQWGGGPLYALKVVPLEPRRKDGAGSNDENDEKESLSSSSRAIPGHDLASKEKEGEDRFEIERRVRAEIAALRSITHENVMNLLSFDFGQDDEQVLDVAHDRGCGKKGDKEEKAKEGAVDDEKKDGGKEVDGSTDVVRISEVGHNPSFEVLPAMSGLTATSTPTPPSPVAYLLLPVQTCSLSELVASERGPIRDSKALIHLVESLCSALCAVHAAGYRHNNLTPDAVMLQFPKGYNAMAAEDNPSTAPRPKVILSSFGSVSPRTVSVNTKWEGHLVRSYHKRRTPAAYRAPELWKVGRTAKSADEKKGNMKFATLTVAADSFSLGAVLFYAMFGRHAFGKKTQGDTRPKRWIATVPCKSYKKVHAFFLRASLALMVENPEWRLTARQLLGEALVTGKLGRSEKTVHLRAVWRDYRGAPGLEKYADLAETLIGEHILKSIEVRPPPDETGTNGGGPLNRPTPPKTGALGPLGMPLRSPSSRRQASGAASPRTPGQFSSSFTPGSDPLDVGPNRVMLRSLVLSPVQSMNEMSFEVSFHEKSFHESFVGTGKLVGGSTIGAAAAAASTPKHKKGGTGGGVARPVLNHTALDASFVVEDLSKEMDEDDTNKKESKNTSAGGLMEVEQINDKLLALAKQQEEDNNPQAADEQKEEDSKVSWLVAEAKADAARMASSLSRSLVPVAKPLGRMPSVKRQPSVKRHASNRNPKDCPKWVQDAVDAIDE